MTILGCDKTLYKKRIKKSFFIIAAVAFSTVLLNVLLTVFRTDGTHIPFLVVNIVTDVAAAWSIYAVSVLAVMPKKRLLALYERGEQSGKERTGFVREVSEKTICVQGFQCFKVNFEVEGTQTECYLIQNGMKLERGGRYKIFTLENVVYMAEESE